jgi:hypothetical protein
VEALDKIRAKIGHKITAVYQILWADKGYYLEWDSGCLEIHFENGDLLFLTVALNGCSPLVRNSPWSDPLAGELDESTQKLILESGRDIKVDVSTIYPFSQFVNHTFDRVNSLHYKDFKEPLGGVQIITGSTILNFYTLWDRGDIAWGANHPRLADNELQVLED